MALVEQVLSTNLTTELTPKIKQDLTDALLKAYKEMYPIGDELDVNTKIMVEKNKFINSFSTELSTKLSKDIAEIISSNITTYLKTMTIIGGQIATAGTPTNQIGSIILPPTIT